MDNRTDIWNRLQEHETPPDKRLWDRLWGVIRFERLSQHDIEPPGEMFALIQTATKRRGLRKWMLLSAAAMLMSVAAVLVLYRPTHTIKAVATAPSLVRRPIAATAVDSSVTVSRPQKAVMVDERPSVYVEGHTYPLVDNDLLLTLTNFSYPLVHHVSVPTGLYSGLAISEQAAAMINTAQETRSNGKPTRKARKMKKRLEDWKKADEKRFDKDGSNVMDPFDLGTFIFKY
jgi:hypothetical protein